MSDNRAWGGSWGDAWGDSWGEGETEYIGPVVDGSGLRAVRKRRHTPAHFRDRTPEDIRREQLEDERYLASLEKQKTEQRGSGDVAESQAPSMRDGEAGVTPGRPSAVPDPILADVAARAASAVQAKLEEARQAAAAARLADDKRRRTLALLLALD